MLCVTVVKRGLYCFIFPSVQNQIANSKQSISALFPRSPHPSNTWLGYMLHKGSSWNYAAGLCLHSSCLLMRVLLSYLLFPCGPSTSKAQQHLVLCVPFWPSQQWFMESPLTHCIDRVCADVMNPHIRNCISPFVVVMLWYWIGKNRDKESSFVLTYNGIKIQCHVSSFAKASAHTIPRAACKWLWG